MSDINHIYFLRKELSHTFLHFPRSTPNRFPTKRLLKIPSQAKFSAAAKYIQLHKSLMVTQVSITHPNPGPVNDFIQFLWKPGTKIELKISCQCFYRCERSEYAMVNNKGDRLSSITSMLFCSKAFV